MAVSYSVSNHIITCFGQIDEREVEVTHLFPHFPALKERRKSCLHCHVWGGNHIVFQIERSQIVVVVGSARLWLGSFRKLRAHISDENCHSQPVTILKDSDDHMVVQFKVFPQHSKYS